MADIEIEIREITEDPQELLTEEQAIKLFGPGVRYEHRSDELTRTCQAHVVTLHLSRAAWDAFRVNAGNPDSGHECL
jgi:hypothetical protein